ncbi:MAG TPA: phosphoribosyltransferase family protein [Thermoanaerobaculia bacterium]|nr:phosphoribosyltransferase family protein [Thermoanaerobaculia bacterium]
MVSGQPKLTLRHPEAEIAARIEEIAARMGREYEDRPLVLLAMLKGTAFFLADLSRKIGRPHGFEFINVTRREIEGKESVEIDFATPLSIAGKEVVVLKDVVNTGVIETYLMNQLRADDPASIRFAAIVDRPHERRSSVLVDYVLFTSTDHDHLVGYGMEHGGQYGHLPYISALSPAAGPETDARGQ